MKKVSALFQGRRFGPRMRQALELVASGCTVRMAAKAAGLRSWQDVAAYAKELGLGRRRVMRREPPARRLPPTTEPIA